jgi:SulP family sulfate permease
VIYRFGTSLYFANAAKLMQDIAALVGHGGPLRWFVLDCAAIEDVDYTASSVLTRVVEYLQRRHIRMAVSSVLDPVRQQFDRYGISKALDPDAWYDSSGEAFAAYQAARKTIDDANGPGASGTPK